jgi:hypothetical protein
MQQETPGPPDGAQQSAFRQQGTLEGHEAVAFTQHGRRFRSCGEPGEFSTIPCLNGFVRAM